MGMYAVERRGEVREVYMVEAESEEAAKANWMDGELFVSETMGTEFYSVQEAED